MHFKPFYRLSFLVVISFTAANGDQLSISFIILQTSRFLLQKLIKFHRFGHRGMVPVAPLLNTLREVCYSNNYQLHRAGFWYPVCLSIIFVIDLRHTCITSRITRYADDNNNCLTSYMRKSWSSSWCFLNKVSRMCVPFWSPSAPLRFLLRDPSSPD